MPLQITRAIYLYLDIWIDVGVQGQVFTYVNDEKIKTNVGDIVKVQLQGTFYMGIVVKGKNRIPKNLYIYQVKAIDDLVETVTLDPSWYTWLQDTAIECHISFFKIFKIAFSISRFKYNNKYMYVKKVNLRLLTGLPLDRNASLANNQLQLINWLRKQNGQYLIELVGKKNRFSRSVINTLNKKAIIDKQIKLISTSHEQIRFFNQQFRCLNTFLNNDQQEAVRIFKSLKLRHGILLWGVTGSGKTEVYIQAAGNQLKTGYNVLILTPEISLIPQLVDRFRKYFNEQVFEYHSGCTKEDRAQVWRNCHNSISSPILIIGTRSAIFLPLNPLGLIVVDEEHDSSYKQENLMPYYNARDLVLKHSKYCDIKFILGSATPSIETWRICHVEELVTLVRLPQRVRGRTLPKIKIIDMRLEIVRNYRNLLSEALLYQLKIMKSLGEQAIILVPRRGYSSFLGCYSCGTIIECPYCDIALTVHQNKKYDNWLHCHWCDYKAVIIQQCQYCGSNTFKAFGTGTQQVIEKLEHALEEFKLIRFDYDTTRGKEKHRELLTQFASGKADILVGTQMLAKGIDLPRVTLSAVLGVDSLLHRSDLRSSEKCLQLLLQLAGRSGRANLSGKMFIQTSYPHHPVIRHLLDGNYENFLIKELSIRKKSILPPYSKTCILYFSGMSDIVTARNAKIIAARIRSECELLGWKLIGPFPATVKRVGGRSRWRLLLHGQEETVLPSFIDINMKQMISQETSVSIDTNPIEL